ncbi:hypothetical protein [Pontibacter ramchanderi]|uniref:Uncharacterized protein n=1 Tax=Pontibacter ramchanderi TaxID=1179743 RepID=A0A2N3V324_9BACT|nr:hypothetical protein [Pontibacter ramchanderi]PKV76021.1 hypothetical protein BD749_0971 [Pontibacter ramchanderi]
MASIMKRWFNWFVLSCFILHVALYFSTFHVAGKSMIQLEELLEGPSSGEGIAEDDSPIDLMLQEYLDLIEDFPRTDTSKPSHKGAIALYKSILKPLPQKPESLLLQAGYSITYTCGDYQPLNFLLSEYHGYLFRFKPF